MSYPALQDVKDYLGVTTTDDDVWLTSVMSWTVDLIRLYLGRNILSAEYTQEAYQLYSTIMSLDNYPVSSLVSVTIDDEVQSLDDYYLSKVIGNVYGDFTDGDINIIVYNGGYTTLPPVIEDVYYGVIEERYGEYKGNTDDPVKDITLFDFGKVSFDAADSSGISYSGVGSGNIPEPLQNFLGRLDLYKSDSVIMSGAGIR